MRSRCKSGTLHRRPNLCTPRPSRAFHLRRKISRASVLVVPVRPRPPVPALASSAAPEAVYRAPWLAIRRPERLDHPIVDEFVPACTGAELCADHVAELQLVDGGVRHTTGVLWATVDGRARPGGSDERGLEA